MDAVRLDKILSQLGYGTRSEVKKLVSSGKIFLNGSPVRKPETKFDPSSDILLYDGKRIDYDLYEYWVLNKPAGILSAVSDSRQKTVIDYMNLKRKGLSPCGRLDKDTEGLLLVTDDGPLIHRLLAPGKHVDKTYEVTAEGILPPDAEKRFREGIVLSDVEKCLPADLKISEPGNPFRARVVIREGKYHQIKRMFETLGCRVTSLKRTAMGPLKLSELGLKTGEYRKLTENEIQEIRGINDRS